MSHGLETTWNKGKLSEKQIFLGTTKWTNKTQIIYGQLLKLGRIIYTQNCNLLPRTSSLKSTIACHLGFPRSLSLQQMFPLESNFSFLAGSVSDPFVHQKLRIKRDALIPFQHHSFHWLYSTNTFSRGIWLFLWLDIVNS